LFGKVFKFLEDGDPNKACRKIFEVFSNEIEELKKG